MLLFLNTPHFHVDWQKSVCMRECACVSVRERAERESACSGVYLCVPECCCPLFVYTKSVLALSEVPVVVIVSIFCITHAVGCHTLCKRGENDIAVPVVYGLCVVTMSALVSSGS